MNRSRQSYYKALGKKMKTLSEHDALLELVGPIRQYMPRIGGRKLHFLLQDQLNEKALKIGRDRFFTWLRDHDLLIRPKRMYVHTTQSNHRFWIRNNLTQTVNLDRINKLWEVISPTFGHWKAFAT